MADDGYLLDNRGRGGAQAPPFPVTSPACARWETAIMAMVGDDLMAPAGVSADELDRHRASGAAGRIDLAPPPMISTRGRKA